MKPNLTVIRGSRETAPGWPWIDLIAAVGLVLMLGLNGCVTRTVIIQDGLTYHLPTPNSTVDKLTYVGWKGWI